MIGYANPPTQRHFLGFSNKAISANTSYKIAELIKKSSENPYIRHWAELITESVKDRDEVGEIKSIFSFLQDKTRYVRDPLGVEYIQTPPYILGRIELGTKPGLDCDDYTTLGLSLLRSLGYPTMIRLAGYGPSKDFSHVYGLVFSPKEDKWIVFDPIRKEKTLGWEAPYATIKADLEI